MEFVNWDQADPEPIAGVDMLSSTGQQLDDIDLALANVAGDDFSFWALQHFENNVSPTLNISEEIPMPTDRSTRTFEDHLEMAEAPCHNCQLGGYQCKKIPEGQYKGYCTSCVALRCECSFGLSCVFPSNPWPVMGDHPRMLREEKNCDATPSSATDMPGFTSTSGADNTCPNEGPKNKVGARFSRESVKILKNWLSTHSKHPYPNDEEKEMLQKQTGLSKTQITNWLANTRRRNKNAVSQRSTSPGVRSWANPIDIPQRRRTSGSLEHMNPLQRWQHSPPENEPASVTAIARAVNSASSVSSGLNSPYSANFTDDGSGRSLCDSNISSANTSRSQSSASAYSYGSRGSFGSGGSIPRGRRRRRRKAPAATTTTHIGPAKTFQCTFCTETFRTKHDWQRHEKSLHLSLERWVCSPNGAQAFNPENGQMSCVFCGDPNPDEAHIDSHNYSACQERTMGERTFYRKDHLRQHLKLVHGTNFTSWSMEQWKATTPEIRSRCGFCGTVMDTWSIRIDHLAAHFKEGKSMKDWKGDWGFDIPVLDMVENSIPPYLIHDERNSPNPYEASQPSTASARHAFELIKSELSFYFDDWCEREGKPPSDEDLQRAACTLIYDTEDVSGATENPKSSWLRDLIFSSDCLAQEARWTRVKGIDCWQQLKINGKTNIFEFDPMETELHDYVKARRLLGLTAMDSELQAEACKIIRHMDDNSHQAFNHVVQFLLRLASSSTEWLADFRQRAHLPRSEDLADPGKRSKDPSTIDSTVHNFSRLEFELAEYVRVQRTLGVEPTDADLQKQARMIIYELDDAWNQTAADDPVWLAAFKQRHVAASTTGDLLGNAPLPATTTAELWWPSVAKGGSSGLRTPSPFSNGSGSGSGSGASNKPMHKMFYINDANCYQRLARELKKWISSTMSPNNPNCHVPTDEELQYQARWIVYEDDDPWNQTAADNFEWLRRFKREVGLLTDPTLPGLPNTLSWNMADGGSGFSPPYLCPRAATANQLTPFPTIATTTSTTTTTTTTTSSSTTTNPTPPGPGPGLVNITVREGGKPIPTAGATANRFVRGLGDPTRHDPPASVFCSRELENALADFVTSAVLAGGGGAAAFPSDEALRERARQFLGGAVLKTPADDKVLLGRFGEVMRRRLGLLPLGGQGLGLGGQQQQQQQGLDGGLGFGMGAATTSTAGMDFSAPSEMNAVDADVMQQMDFDFSDLGDFMGVATGGMPMDQL
ncbi:C2H2 transcription factor [Chaetomium tenue]|uniref:C2H2 transcription factor n=1 Tax=Chaetomium tenue TaxID=1854479 RepID=A0ACB7PAZ2_9PEZI|nr:C2H2 transcription factor [Chaetomium globosum]